MDDLFLDELPQCTKTDESVEGRLDLCDVDPREDENNKSHLKSLKNKHKIETISNFPTSHSYWVLSFLSKLVLESVNRHFSGNFSCIGVSEAGMSKMSEPIPLEVKAIKIFLQEFQQYFPGILSSWLCYCTYISGDSDLQGWNSDTDLSCNRWKTCSIQLHLVQGELLSPASVSCLRLCVRMVWR